MIKFSQGFTSRKRYYNKPLRKKNGHWVCFSTFHVYLFRILYILSNTYLLIKSFQFCVFVLFHGFSYYFLYACFKMLQLYHHHKNSVTKKMFDSAQMTSYDVQRPSCQQFCRTPLFCLVQTGSSGLELRRLTRLLVS
jgi:hypothetical protein